MSITSMSSPLSASEILKLIEAVPADLEHIRQRDARQISDKSSWSYSELEMTVLSKIVRVTSYCILRDENHKTLNMKLEDWNFPLNARAKRFLKTEKFEGKSLLQFQEFFTPAARYDKLKVLVAGAGSVVD
jgi:hypothetical protein